MFDTESIQRAVSRSTVVINLVGIHDETLHWNYHDTHVKCAYRLAQLAKEAGVTRFIHVSALAATPDSESRWLATKALSEDAVRVWYPDATILRPAPLFGEEDWFLNRLAYMLRFLPVMPIIHGGGQYIQPCYVGDVAQAIVNATTMPATIGKTYHLGGPRVFSYAELVDICRRNIYLENNMVNMTEKAASNIARLIEFLPAGHRVLSRDLITQMNYDRIVPETPGILGFKELRVSPQGLFEHATQMMLRHREERGPSRFGHENDESWLGLERPTVAPKGVYL